MSAKWITQNRINQQMKSIAKQRPAHLFAAPLPDNMFIWHFTIRGPQNTNFHEGLYHGEIVLPKQYPFKPPEIHFINQNGRFQPLTKICLSITQYHPETWSAGISIRMMLQAIIAIFDDNIPGIGSVHTSPLRRKKLARDSHKYSCQQCGQIKSILAPREAIDPNEVLTDTINQKTEKTEEAFKQFIEQIPNRIKQQQQKIQEPKPQQNQQGGKQQVPPSTIKRFFNWFKKKQ